jgi:hypothetical protein
VIEAVLLIAPASTFKEKSLNVAAEGKSLLDLTW